MRIWIQLTKTIRFYADPDSQNWKKGKLHARKINEVSVKKGPTWRKNERGRSREEWAGPGPAPGWRACSPSPAWVRSPLSRCPARLDGCGLCASVLLHRVLFYALNKKIGDFLGYFEGAVTFSNPKLPFATTRTVTKICLLLILPKYRYRYV